MASERFKIITATLLITAFLSFSFILYSSSPSNEFSVPENVMSGKKVWQQNNCNACHQVYGLGGYLGPDLTNVYSKRGAAIINAFLVNGTATMPRFSFDEKETRDLITFLESIDKSGNADPRRFKINYDGTISPN